MPSRTHEVLPVLVDPLPQTFGVLVVPLLEATVRGGEERSVEGRGGRGLRQRRREGETREAGRGS